MTISPGEILLEQFLIPLGMGSEDFALSAGIPGESVSGIIEGSVKVDPVMAKCLSAALGTSVDLWLNLQENYDKANFQ